MRHLKESDRIAQLIVERIAFSDPVWAAELTGSDR